MGEPAETTLKPLLDERPRVTSLLTTTQKYRAVVICAPAGSGKTTAVRHYVARSAGTADYYALDAATTQAKLAELLSAERGAWEIVLDNVDKSAPSVVDSLVQHIRQDAGGSRIILVGRSRSAMRAHGLLATGIATWIDAGALAFTNGEVMALADRLGAPHDAEAVVQLLHDTDGWAIAVAWLVRDAADAQRALRGAFETWREQHGHILLEFLATEYEHELDAFREFKALLRDGSFSARGDLERFEALGFPVARTRTSVRPYRILAKLTRQDAEPAENAYSGSPLLNFNALGRFRCSFGGRDVVFQRRRDRNVFTYVALAPEGRVTREDLLNAFWPGTNRALATQGLRTTLSRIRNALGQVVGPDSVDHFFYSADDVRVHFAQLAFDVQRFNEHYERARIEDAREDPAAAKYHYAAAARLYRDRLLSSESIEPCFFAQRDELEKRYAETLERLVRLYTAEANFEAARSCASKLQERAVYVNARPATGALLDAARPTTA